MMVLPKMKDPLWMILQLNTTPCEPQPRKPLGEGEVIASCGRGAPGQQSQVGSGLCGHAAPPSCREGGLRIPTASRADLYE